MAKYTSGRQKNIKVGIKSYSEDLTSLEIIGKVGVGTVNASINLTVGGGVGAGIVAWSNVIYDNVHISPPYRTGMIYVDKDLMVDIEPGFEVTIDDGCYLNIIDI